MCFEDIKSQGVAELKDAGLKPEYFSIRRTVDLGEVGPSDKEVSVLAAAWLGSARLIDNVKVLIK